MLRIAEVFDSIQGEGQLAGTASSFVRLSGCNLRCWFCDTPYTSWSPEGPQRRWQEVVEQVCGFPSQHVVVTGGEPLLQPDVVALTRELQRRGRHVTIETAGTVDRPVAADLMSLSPKRANSTPEQQPWRDRHEQLRHNPRVVREFLRRYECQLKFVIDRPDDLEDVEQYLREFPECPREWVWLMPQGRDAAELAARAEWLQPAAEQRGFQFARRLHIEWWGNTRGV